MIVVMVKRGTTPVGTKEIFFGRHLEIPSDVTLIKSAAKNYARPLLAGYSEGSIEIMDIDTKEVFYSTYKFKGKKGFEWSKWIEGPISTERFKVWK